MIKPEFFEKKEVARQAYRAMCVAAANEFVELCAAMGVDVVIFGSLTRADAFFRSDSDIDLCVMTCGKMNYLDIEFMALDFFASKGILFDLWERSMLNQNVLNSVITEGRKHVE